MTPPSRATTTVQEEASSPQRAPDLWHGANDVLYVHDLDGRFVAVNATAVATYGYSEREFLAMSIGDLVDPAHLGTAQANLRAKATGAADRTPPYEVLTRAKDGRPVWLEVSTRIVREDGRPAVVHGAARDITARKQAEAIADLVHETALALNEAPSLQAGVQETLRRVCSEAGWAYAEAWFPEADGRTLTLGPQWLAAEGLEKFSRLARQYRFAPGEGLPGGLYQQAKTLRAPELPPDIHFPRRAAALAAGLRTVFGIPVLSGGRFAAALLFFGSQPKPDDARWVAAAEKVAAHVGASIARRLDVERVRSAGRMFAAQFEALSDAMLLLDADGTPRHANAAFLTLAGARLRSTDAALPLLDRIEDAPSFLAAVATLYEGRREGRGTVDLDGRRLQRAVLPLRSRTGASLGVLLQLREDAPTSPRP